ncbi:CHAD domain-containing protein [Geminocystis sp. NIES-3709]|uniref:CHAD domain-containing protein n=1 Tax=Geminocystis sp. NIES-3709 TaxID=1617448 RepID=UPI0005FC8FDC|nr:CHAD domain-containing protein [Geminocystis sp. NIES-3709]BAQ63541.1 adenylate cyclase [Geminocystis sp. NIES-3709]
MVNFTLKDNPITTADFAFNAIAKQINKISKYEQKILTEDDPENLHQIRVGMRRLRSVLSVFDTALIIPSTVNEQKIGNIARILGKQRDLDILKINLECKFNHESLDQESKIIKKIIQKIDKPTSKKFDKNITDILKNKKYQHLKEDLFSWLENPQYNSIASRKIEQILPDLLLPQISTFFLQSGWLIGTEILDRGDIIIKQNLLDKDIYLLINQQGFNLHKLRKEAKKTRYQLELFTDFYPEEYQTYLEFIVKVQEVLGEIQDHLCLHNHLTEVMGNKWQKKLNNLHDLIVQDKLLKWQEWQDLQIKFFSGDFCHNLRHIINNISSNNIIKG